MRYYSKLLYSNMFFKHFWRFARGWVCMMNLWCRRPPQCPLSTQAASLYIKTNHKLMCKKGTTRSCSRKKSCQPGAWAWGYIDKIVTMVFSIMQASWECGKQNQAREAWRQGHSCVASGVPDLPEMSKRTNKHLRYFRVQLEQRPHARGQENHAVLKSVGWSTDLPFLRHFLFQPVHGGGRSLCH